MNPIFSLIRW